jgi:hypothetical protein
MRLRCVAITSQSSTSALQSQTNELQEVSCHDRWEEGNTDGDGSRCADVVPGSVQSALLSFVEGATMKIAGSKSERRLMRFAGPKSSLGVSLFAIGGWKGFGVKLACAGPAW